MPACLYQVPSDQCLISLLVESLVPCSPEQLSQTVLVLPTQRLGTFVLAALLQHHSALVPPRILTLEQFLTSAAPQTSHVIGEGALDLLLVQLLQAGNYQHLREGHERELRLLYGELFDHGLFPQAFETLKTALRDDIYRSEEHLGSLYQRAEEMEDILLKLNSILTERGLLCRQAHLARAAQSLAQDWHKDPWPAQRFVVAAYTSLAHSWQGLLEVWGADPRFSFWISEAPELFHPTSPLKELNLRLEKIMNSQSLGILPPRVQELMAAAAPNPLEEVRWGVQVIQDLIKAGFAPESLALLVTDEARYAPLLRESLEELSCESNLALAFPFAASIPGRFLTALEQLWREDEDLPSILRCLAQKPLQNWLCLEREGSPSELGEQLEELILETQVPRGLKRVAEALKAPWREPFERFIQILWTLAPQQKKTLSQWTDALHKLVTAFDLWECEVIADWKRSCEEVYEEFLETLRILQAEDTTMEGSVFWELLRSHLLSSEIRSTGEPLSGVQVLIVTEARYVPFDAVVLLGCQEGSFPKALPQDELIDNYLKKAMGLPGWEVLEAMEDQTFHLLKSRLPHLLLLRSLRSGEDELQRSRFTESYLIKTGATEKLWSEASWRETSPIAAENLSLEPEGVTTDGGESFRSTMSASRLSQLIRCPYAFLLSSLSVRGLETPPPWGDVRKEGEWLHAVLEALITGKQDDKTLLDPWPSENLGDIAAEALERLTQLSHLLAPPELRWSAFFTHLIDSAWPKFAKHLAELWTRAPTAALAREYPIESKGPRVAKIQLGGKERLLHGRIDAIDPHPHWMHVTDYKRRNPPPLKDGLDGTAPQLAFYALALQELEPHWAAKGLVFGYWNIAKGEWTAQAVSEKVKVLAEQSGFVKKDCPDVNELIENLRELWLWREQELDMSQRYYADPSACELCSYEGICRKEDPRVREQLQSQQRLAQRKAGVRHDA